MEGAHAAAKLVRRAAGGVAQLAARAPPLLRARGAAAPLGGRPRPRRLGRPGCRTLKGGELLPIESPARLWDTVAAIGRDEGVEALFRGALLRVLYTGVVVAALIPIRTLGYVAVRDWFILERF